MRLWAEQAGLQLDPDLARQALAEDATGPEHLFTLLLQATGIAT
jgi:hypothetical protein